MILEQLRESIARAAGINSSLVTLEHPSDLSHGDYATNIALVLGKEKGVSPRAFAEELARMLLKNKPKEVADISVAGPGFINFTLSREFFSDSLSFILKTEEEWGNTSLYEGKRVMVEYTDPNPFKEMHIGHLMSNTIGEALARLFEFGGAEVFRVTYQGDVGLHVAKALYGMTLLEKEGVAFSPELIGKAYTRGSALYETDEAVKKEIHEINRAVYEQRPEWQRLYGFGKQMSLEAFEEIYAALGTEFDRNFFESESTPRGRALIAEGLEKGVFEVSDQAVIYRGEKVGLHTRVFQTKDGVPTYEGKELGLPALKEEVWPHDISVVVTANEQTEYFKVVQAAFRELRPSLARKMIHLAHGFLRLPEGKMSSRTGNVVPARELIVYARDQAALLAKDSDTAHAIGVGAIKYAILKQRAGSDTVFDSAQALSLVGDSGPYLQYARVRALSILAQASEEKALEVPIAPYPLERLLYRFPEVVLRAQEERAPHHVAHFLTEVASVWNRFYAEERIVGGEYEAYKRVLARACAITMTRGLVLLGIPTPERM